MIPAGGAPIRAPRCDGGAQPCRARQCRRAGEGCRRLAESETLNAGAPETDTDAHGKRVHSIASAAARLAGLADPDAHAEHVQAAFLPDLVIYRPGQPASFQPGSGNGRALDDDAFDIAVAVLAGSTLGTASVPRPPAPKFPYLSAPISTELPALADLFGLREHGPE